MSFKQKIDNYLYYYKWHTLLGIFALIVCVVSIVQCSQRTQPDLEMVYIGHNYVSTDDFQNYVSELTGDINGDGKKYVFCDNITVSKEIKSETDMAMSQKIMLMFADGEKKVFIAPRGVLESYADGLEDLSKILPAESLDGALEYEGAKIAISAEQCPVLNQYGLSDRELYVAILSLWDEEDALQYDAAMKIIQELAR